MVFPTPTLDIKKASAYIFFRNYYKKNIRKNNRLKKKLKIKI